MYRPPVTIGLLHYSNDRANFKSLQMEINKKSILRSSEIMNKRELWVESPQAVVATSQSFTDEDIGVLKTRHRIQNNELFSYFSFWLLEMFSQFQEKQTFQRVLQK